MNYRRLRATQPCESESGSALAIALIFLAVVGTITAVSLSYAQTSLNGYTKAVRPDRVQLNGADAALQTAIKYVQDNPRVAEDFGVTPGACVSNAISVPVAMPDGTTRTAAVNICPQTDSFLLDNEARALVLTLGTDPNDGIILSHNGDMVVNGDVFSNSVIKRDLPNNPARLKVHFGDVWSVGACDAGGIVVDPSYALHCNATGTGKLGTDPGVLFPADYAPGASSVGAVPNAVPTPCAGGTTTKALPPGYYTDVAALNALTASCTNVTLSSGTYLLEFGSKPNAVWTIPNTVTGTAHVVDATRNLWACNTGSAGERLVLADMSSLKVTGQLALCGSKSTTTGPRIGLLGLKTSIPSSSPFTVTPTTAVSDPLATATFPNSGQSSFPAGALTIGDGQLAKARTNANSDVYVVDYSGLAQPFPAGAVMKLRVSHSEDAGFPTVLLTSSNLSTCTVTLPSHPALLTDEIALTSQVCPASWNPVGPLTAQYTIDPSSKNKDVALDGLELTDLGMPAQSGCNVTPASPCTILDVGTNNGNVAVDGAVYVPTNAIAPPSPNKLNNAGQFSFGSIVARTLVIESNPNTSGLQVGAGAPGHRLGKVLFSVSISGRKWLNAYVQYAAGGSPQIVSYVQCTATGFTAQCL